MKILIVNTFDIAGGAARAAYRLHKGLVENGINSQMLVQNKDGDDYTVLSETGKLGKIINKIRPIFDSIPIRVYKKRSKTLFSPACIRSKKLINKINSMKPDVVHLHWINAGMLRIEDLPKINAPIVWSLHDNWAFTGGCHIKWECEKYKESCGSCPRLGSLKENDLSRKIYLRKHKTFPKIANLTIIGLSKWIASCSKSSSLLKNRTTYNLPNMINTNLYKPFDKNSARELLNLPQDKKLILFGANSATKDVNKGFKELLEALSNLKREDFEFLVFGSSEPIVNHKYNIKTHYLGILHDDISLNILYNTADVLIVPSFQENLSNTIMESMACGTPVVAFNIGGNSDMIEHKTNGYLVKPFSATDMAKGISWVINDKERWEILSKASRNKVINEFDQKTVAIKYIELYHSVLKEKY